VAVAAVIEWSVIIAAVLSSALVSGVVTTLLTGRHERHQQIRGKMLEVADQFSTALLEALRDLRRVHPIEGETREFPAPKKGELPWDKRSAHVAELVAKARTSIDDAQTSRGRILVLYRPSSAVSSHSQQALELMKKAVDAADLYGEKPDVTELDTVVRNCNEASTAVDRFCDHAWQALSSPLGASPWQRLRIWFRQRRQVSL
jgi:hypothetical protein